MHFLPECLDAISQSNLDTIVYIIFKMKTTSKWNVSALEKPLGEKYLQVQSITFL